MSKELVIGSNRHETKVAILEDDQLVEVYFQRANEYSLAGSIHKGRVTRVLPGMQSAFVDLGLERDTFLYVSDFFEEHDDIDTVEDKPPARVETRERDRGDRDRGDRDRGDRDRGRGRDFERRLEAAPEPVDISSVGIETVSEPDADGSNDEVPPPVSDVQPHGGVREIRRTERPDNDPRNGGDRRGRRSRRSRSRGSRGFPDNKYAQPSTAQSSSSSSEPELNQPTLRVQEEPGDVIMLPGESLAKYRRTSTAPEPRREEAPRFDEEPFTLGLSEEDQANAEEEQETAEEIEARVEELELTDAVLAHHPEEVEDELGSEGSSALERPIVEDHEPPSLFIVEHVEPEPEPEPGDSMLPDEFREEGESEPSHRFLAEEEPRDEELGRADAFFVPVTESSQIDAAENEAADLDDVLESPGEEGSEVRFAGAPSTLPVLGGEPAGTSQAQTAEVREQGGRYMHRMSRRMRRRRGGNRSNNQEFSNRALENEAPPAITPAPAFQKPEPKPEPEVRNLEMREERSMDKPDRVLPSISDLLKSGQEIIVQIAKEPLGQKGARITSHIALPGRFVVFMPSVNHLGVSRKIASDEERQRLKKILQAHRVGTTGGFIVRTAGEGVPEDEIAADMAFLYSLWLDIRQKAEKKPAPLLLHCDLDVVQRILRDQVTDEFKAIWVDNEELYESILGFIQRFQPALVGRVKMYTRSAPIFDSFNITQELEKALRPKVWLKSGGYIVINQTEALVAIDINTGKYVGKSNRLEDTIVKTNTEAVKEIVRQIRLRDLGGIIVVDFIDMDERKNRQKVMQALEEAMRADKAPYKILQFNDFGLVAITRKRVKQSLERTLCAPCPYCEGAGYVKSVQTIVSEILIEAQKIAKATEGNNVVLRVHPEVAKVLKANSNRYLEELEEVLGRPVLVTGDPNLHHERFDLA